MTIGILGDVHADHLALDAAFRFLKALKSDLIVCTGDLCDGPGDVNACVQLLSTNQIPTVIGNHDEWCLAGELRSIDAATRLEDLSVTSRNYLHELPKTIRLDVDGEEVVLCHGILENTMNKINEDDFGYALEVNEELQRFIRFDTARVMVNGHSHRQMVRRFGDKLLINAGTVLREGERCVSTADFSRRIVTFYQFVDGEPTEIGAYQKAM